MSAARSSPRLTVLRLLLLLLSLLLVVVVQEAWRPRPFPVSKGTLYKYIKNVAPASLGCVTDE